MSKPTVLARFHCTECKTSKHSWGATREVSMSAVISVDDDDPNKVFFDSTPAGEVTMSVVSEETFEFFEPGATYELAFRRVD